MRTACFTLQYAAPEVIDQGLPQTSCSANGYNESCDLWSLGVILVILLTFVQGTAKNSMRFFSFPVYNDEWQVALPGIQFQV